MTIEIDLTIGLGGLLLIALALVMCAFIILFLGFWVFIGLLIFFVVVCAVLKYAAKRGVIPFYAKRSLKRKARIRY